LDLTLLLTWIAIMGTGTAGVWTHAKRATERARKRIDGEPCMTKFNQPAADSAHAVTVILVGLDNYMCCVG
jgi:hypothetical protein